MTIIRSYEHKWERLTAFYSYPTALWNVLYTTNWLERMNREFRAVLKNKSSLSH